MQADTQQIKLPRRPERHMDAADGAPAVAGLAFPQCEGLLPSGFRAYAE
jgi:hypothetical protein